MGNLKRRCFAVLKSPWRAVNALSNFVCLKFFNTSYGSFPAINGRIVKRGPGRLVLGARVSINSNLQSNPVGLSERCLFYVASSAEIRIGNNVGISNSLLYSQTRIDVKDDVLIGGGCQILDTDFHSLDYASRVQVPDTGVRTKAVVIEKGAFIGASSIVLKGVTIGEKSVVGAGSVVSKDIPANQLWAGNPAKFIRDV